MCAKAPTAIIAVLGPHSYGKTALLKAVLNEKPYFVYINCRGISTPASFVQHLLTSMMPKAPVGVQEMVMNSLQLRAGGLAAKVSMASDVIEEFFLTQADLVKLLVGIHSKTPAAVMNAFLDAFRYAMV